MRALRVTPRARSISSSVAFASLCTFIKENGEETLMYFPNVIWILLYSLYRPFRCNDAETLQIYEYLTVTSQISTCRKELNSYT